MYLLQFRTSVEQDIREVRIWYNQEKIGLGNLFEEAAFSCFERILEAPFHLRLNTLQLGLEWLARCFRPIMFITKLLKKKKQLLFTDFFMLNEIQTFGDKEFRVFPLQSGFPTLLRTMSKV